MCVALISCVLLLCRYLYGFEEYSTSTSITFRMALPLKQGPKGEAKVEGEEAGGPAGAMGPPATSSTEDKTNPEGEPSPAAASVSKVHLLPTHSRLLSVHVWLLQPSLLTFL